ncbi:hypothetical protein C8A05DRAFT_46534 [Staphylotrichum tortipilum]|uniref:DUF541 domain-containing protein n=1 Tax=Staphylotrichum tortipilum TaxID=2831512 RepID=A0AAN6MG89_9PEZI|nr:hypothetical protein C8A05DRAFT_46534 [Staphylotrichum longicolle]
MTPLLEVHVDGKGSSFRTAERGYLRLNISAAGTDQAKASSEVQNAVAKITAVFRALALKTAAGLPHPDAAVTAFTVTPLSTVSQYQRDDKYRFLTNLPKEHTVSASAEIIFRDMAKLAEISADLALAPHVSMSETEWRLTEATRAELEREARRKAIANAVEKAQDYAAVVGREIVAVEIKDLPQARGWYGSSQPQAMMQQQFQQQQQYLVHQQAIAQAAAAAGKKATGEPEGLTLEPKTIMVSASVNVKFVSVDVGVGQLRVVALALPYVSG